MFEHVMWVILCMVALRIQFIRWNIICSKYKKEWFLLEHSSIHACAVQGSLKRTSNAIPLWILRFYVAIHSRFVCKLTIFYAIPPKYNGIFPSLLQPLEKTSSKRDKYRTTCAKLTTKDDNNSNNNKHVQ